MECLSITYPNIRTGSLTAEGGLCWLVRRPPALGSTVAEARASQVLKTRCTCKGNSFTMILMMKKTMTMTMR